MSMSVQLTPQELQLISDALSSHRAWLTRTLEKSFVHHLKNRIGAATTRHGMRRIPGF